MDENTVSRVTKHRLFFVHVPELRRVFCTNRSITNMGDSVWETVKRVVGAAPKRPALGMDLG
ncbi:MAG TPA: hypothetical protein VF135_09355, partial [Terriglobales bacterium]